MSSTQNMMLGLRLWPLGAWQEPVEENGGVPILVWILILIALALFVAFVVWWYRRGSAQEQGLPATHAEVPAPETGRAATFEVPPAAPAEPAAADNLELIEGIGPSIAGVLQSAGITTFAQLAATEVARLREILVAAKLRFIDPGSWPEQARHAAAGDWAAFEALQKELRGGRRV